LKTGSIIFQFWTLFTG